jgi:hypothetical protein
MYTKLLSPKMFRLSTRVNISFIKKQHETAFYWLYINTLKKANNGYGFKVWSQQLINLLYYKHNMKMNQKKKLIKRNHHATTFKLA